MRTKDSRARADQAATTPAARFDRVSIALHWLTLVLVLAQLTTAWLLGRAGDDPGAAATLLTVHRSTGVLVWWVVAARLVWRARFAALPPFPASMPRVQQWAATANEYGLYALLLAQPLTGLGDTVFRGRPFGLFLWRVPALMDSHKAVFRLFHAAHEAGAVALLALIGLHTAAAVFHGLVLRDGVLQRMLPGRTR
jgi:cytochrome b561